MKQKISDNHIKYMFVENSIMKMELRILIFAEKDFIKNCCCATSWPKLKHLWREKLDRYSVYIYSLSSFLLVYFFGWWTGNVWNHCQSTKDYFSADSKVRCFYYFITLPIRLCFVLVYNYFVFTNESNFTFLCVESSN